MAVNLSPIFVGQQFLTANAQPLSGGKINTYQAGTSTPQTTYTDSAGSTPNNNPIILDSTGRPPSEIWLTRGQSYKFVLTDSLNNVIVTLDNITGINDINGLTTAGNTVLGGAGNTLNVGAGAFTVDGAGNIAATGSETIGANLTVTGTSSFSGNPSGKIVGGTYTPTVSNTTNVTSSTPRQSMYLRLGNVVSVAGEVGISPTAPSVVAFTLSLPIASTISSVFDVAGTLNTSSVAADEMNGVIGDTTNHGALVQFSPAAGGVRSIYFTFHYLID
jgi:hypothetical protein